MRYYYAHGGRCAEGGLHSIEADDAHKLIDDWLGTIAKDKHRFSELADSGRAELRKRLRAVQSNLKRLGHEDAALRKKLHDATTQSLSGRGSATEALREREADKLLDQLQENEREAEHQRHEAEALAAILETTDAVLFRTYADRIRRFLKSSARDKSRRVGDLVQSLTLGELGLRIELIHPNGSKLPTEQAAAFVRDTVPLPGVLLLKSREFLRRLYLDDDLSARAIARRINVGVTTVTDYLQRHGITDESVRLRGKKRPRQVSFGYDLKDGNLVPNRKEQKVIRTIRQLRAAGLTYRDIAAHLNRKLIPTKRGGIWEPGMLQRIFNRSNQNGP